MHPKSERKKKSIDALVAEIHMIFLFMLHPDAMSAYHSKELERWTIPDSCK
jgi:hypothetical protein